MIVLNVHAPLLKKSFPVKLNTHNTTIADVKETVIRLHHIDPKWSFFLKPTKDIPDGIWLEEETNMLHEYHMQHGDALECGPNPDRRKDKTKLTAADDPDIVSLLDPVGDNDPACVLKAIKGPLTGQTFVVGPRGAIIGRSRTFGCQIVIPGASKAADGDITVSRQHAEVLYKNGGFSLRNLSEHNVTGVLVPGTGGVLRLNKANEMELFSVGHVLLFS